jgi:leader peptidase (prepilin peptidase) / N-methyltransferase
MLLLIFIFGLIIGSFLNSLIYRLRFGGNIFKERSRCPHCHKTLSWFELIPLLSFALQLGKCRSCRQKISWQYPLVELMTALLFLVSYLITSGSPTFTIQNSAFHILQYWFFMAVLVCVFVLDFKWQIIPDSLTLPAMALAFLMLLVGFDFSNILYHLLAAAIGAGFFALQYFVSSGRWIGGGDIRLGALMGLMLGWPAVLLALMLAYIVGALTSIPLLLTQQKTLKSQLPFGTFLSLATLITLFWSQPIINWYFNLV